MNPDYYAVVACHFNASRAQLEPWLDQITDIGEELAPDGMYDVDFSATLGQLVREIGVHSAHTMLVPRRSVRAETWQVHAEAQAHAVALLARTDALEYLRTLTVEVTYGRDRHEQRLMYTISSAVVA